jgi:hypothetical protein
MAFDPSAHLMKLPQRKKDDRGTWVTSYEDYLAVKWRIVWFREKCPHGSITTEAVSIDWAQGVAIYKATVEDGEGGKATATGTETRKSFEDFVEKSETRAVGRALALLGFGTQFVGEELSEGEHVADSPVVTSPPPVMGNPITEQNQPLPQHPSQEEIDRLFQVAEACREPKEAFGRRLREIMGLGGDVRISKKYLIGHMSPTQYEVAMAYYQQLLKRQVEEDVPDGSPQKDNEPDASTAVPQAGDEPNATEASLVEARAKLRAEAAWGVRESEVDHVLQHHQLTAARNILWKARRQQGQPTLMASAAD